MSEDRIVLVTGGDRDPGREAVRQLVDSGNQVHPGSRYLQRRRPADTGGRLLLLDVADGGSVDGVASDAGRLELLINRSPVIVNVSSGMGSLTRANDGGSIESSWTSPASASSQAAVHIPTVQYARAFPEIRVSTADPGLTSTDATGGMGESVEDGVRAILTAGSDSERAPTGAYRLLRRTCPMVRSSTAVHGRTRA